MSPQFFLGQQVKVIVDRPLGSTHPNFPQIKYPINYGFIPNTSAGDGEEVDAYVLGVDQPISEFEGQCIAAILRKDDNEFKLIVAPDAKSFSDDEIREMTKFQEQYFKITIIRE